MTIEISQSMSTPSINKSQTVKEKTNNKPAVSVSNYFHSIGRVDNFLKKQKRTTSETSIKNISNQGNTKMIDFLLECKN